MKKRHENFTVITAGGIGSRMKSEVPKQFLLINELPVLMHTINKFYSYSSSMKIILTLPFEHISYWQKLVEKYLFKVPHIIVEGGKTRFESVKNALKHVTDDGFTAIHDGVRPLVSLKTIDNAFIGAEKYGNSVASQEIVFSLRKVEGDKNISVNRELYKEIQTPQVFNTKVLKEAYNQTYNPLFTDDSSVVEAFGKTIYLSEGNSENIKITKQSDLILAETLIRKFV